MDEELRMRKLEMAVNNANLKLNVHDGMLLRIDKTVHEQSQDITMLHEILKETQKQTSVLLEIAPTIQRLAGYAEKTYDVVSPLSRISGVIIKFGALILVVWHGIKWGLAKLAIIS